MRYPGTDGDLQGLRFVAADLESGVLTVTLNRPAQHNVIDVALSQEMERLLRAVHVDQEVLVVVLRGAGDSFCAGIDGRDFADPKHGDEMTLRALREAANEWRTRLLRMLPQPAVAMVHGACRGGALPMIESCDIVFAADDAVFSVEDGADGGATFDGREAEIEGLITRSLPAAQLEAETYAVARELAAKDPIALRFTKETLLYVGSMSFDAAISFHAAKLAELKTLQAGRPSTRAAAIESFLAGKSKPGLG
jgi:trans-feruloyl-CoA hydratase/vanillin synthase